MTRLWPSRLPTVLLLSAGVALLVGSGCASSSAPVDAGSDAPPPAEEAAPATDFPPSSMDGALGEAKDAYARRHLIRGLTRARLGETEAAIRNYEKALQAAPEAPAILSALAEALAAQGDFSTALYHAEQAQRLAAEADSGAAHYRRQLARLHHRAGQPGQALAAYEALEDENTSPALLVEMLPLYRETGNAEGAERTLKALVQKAPPQKARALLEAALGDDAEAASLLAATYRQAGRPEDAAALAGRTSPPPPGSAGDAAGAEAAPAKLVERARTLRRENASEAARLLQRALRQDSTQAEALALLGEIRLAGGAYTEAADLLTRSLDENPRAPNRWARAAEAHLEADQAARAAAVAEEGLLLFPGQLPLLHASADALMQAGRDAEATRRFEEALRVMKADGRLENADGAAQAARFHEALARLHERQGETAEATRHRRQARTLRERRSTASN